MADPRATPAGRNYDPLTDRRLLLWLREEELGVQAEVFFGELVGLAGLAEEALDHAHLGVEVVQLSDEDGLGRRGDHGCAPLKFALVTENYVFEAFEQIMVELHREPGLTDELVAEHDVPLKDASATARGSKLALILDHLAGVVQEHAGHREVGVDLGIEREHRATNASDVDGVL